jgi:ubiquitin C-terminal hydrolase
VTGLANVGVTCYINAALQVLIASPTCRDAIWYHRRSKSDHMLECNDSMNKNMAEVIQAAEPPHSCPSACVVCALQNMLYDMSQDHSNNNNTPLQRHSHRGVVPAAVLDMMCGTAFIDQQQQQQQRQKQLQHQENQRSESYFLFSIFRQGDAYEFLQNLLSKAKDQHGSVLPQLFTGAMGSTIRCNACGHCSTTTQSTLDISLSLFNEARYRTLNDLWKSTFVPEVMNGRNQYRCGGCDSYQDAERSPFIKSFPPILLIHIHRLVFDILTQEVLKYDFEVDIPLVWRPSGHPETDSKLHSPTYRLRAVACHVGHSADSGHYISYVRSGKKWFCVDDSSVYPVRLEQVLDPKQSYLTLFEQVNDTATIEAGTERVTHAEVWQSSNL